MPIIGIMAESGQVSRLGSFYQIATLTTDGATNTFTFSSIPQTYKSLQIRYGLSDTTGNQPYLQFNGDTAANYYAGAQLVQTTSWASGTILYGVSNATNIQGIPTFGYLDIHNYASTSKQKVVKGVGNKYLPSTPEFDAVLFSGIWSSTAAITSITFNTGGYTPASGQTIALYGVN